MRSGSGMWTWLAGAVVAAGFSPVAAQGALLGQGQGQGSLFRRIASFPVFLNTSVDDQSVAEIVASADGGNLLVYTDSENENIGFVDISDPYDPAPDGVVPLSGEPTSVAVRGKYALACVNTSADFIDTSGDLEVIDITTRQIVRTIPLGGQPDAIAISPNGLFAAIAIENERDEDLGDGAPPQLPAGFVVIVRLFGPPALWTTQQVDLVGIPTLFPEDPEPEYVDINKFDVAVVTLQENNHIVLISCWTGSVIADFPAGSVSLTDIDVLENDLIEQTGSLQDVAREPDAVAWTSPFTFSTADEGDLFGGSRGFTNFAFNGFPLFQAGNSIEHLAARLGHYPESRSENKGTEPEGIEFGQYGGKRFLFVGSERSNLVFVYQLLKAPFLGASLPFYRQALPTGVAPEGLLAIPERNLFVVACEEDSRDDKIRATVMIYELGGMSTYPNIVSDDRPGTGVPIPWAALSGLVVDPNDDATLYTVYDSYYQRSRIFTLANGSNPARITDELVIRDANGVLQGELDALKAQLPGTDDFDPANVVNADGTVNLDPEGIAVASDGTFWVASEGTGNLVDGVSDPDDRPFESPNALVNVDPATGDILDAVFPPLAVTLDQLRFGFEGVAATDDALFVAFQRAWPDAGDPSDRARIGRFDLNARTWSFAHYPLDAVTSPAGGWVGLSELTHLGGDDFAVLERDNQGGPDAAVKRVYAFSIAGVDFLDESQVGSFELLSKSLAVDLLAVDAYGPGGGPVPEKQEGMAVLSTGTTLIVNDNDGVEDNNGETRLIELPGLFD